LDQFTYVKRGYDPEEVDKYISTLEQVIKSYKDKDNAIKNAIISAQVAADNVMRNAQMNADAYKAQIGEQLVEIRGALDRQRTALQSFQEDYVNMVRKTVQELEQSTTMTDLFARLEEAETAISDLEGLEAASGPTAASPTSGHIPVDEARPDYLAQEKQASARNWDAQHEQPRDQRPRDYEQSMEYGREVPPARRDMRDATRDDIRDVMRPDRRDPMPLPIHETLFDTDREMRPASREYDPHREERNVRSHSRDTLPTPAHDMAQHGDMRGHGREMQPDPRVHGRDMYAPQHEQIPGHDMRSQVREVHHHEPTHREIPQDHYGYDTPPHQSRDHSQQMQDWDAREYAPERGDMRRDVPRDARREPGRDMRDTARDVRRDPNRDIMRTPPPQQPMRELGRSYMHDGNDYPDDEQNLLPPVASLM